MDLVIFDLDNTLLEGDSDYLWGQFLVEKGVVEQSSYEKTNRYYHQQYLAGKLDIYAFLEFAFKPLTEHDYLQLNQWRQQYLTEKIYPIMREKGQALINQHYDKGDLVMIITATNSFITSPIAKAFGVEHLIGTDPEYIDGKFTGKVAGTPSYQYGKVTRLEQWLKENNPEYKTSWFYSDSHNDIPLLSKVNHAFAVDPDDILKQHAKQHNWPIISLAKD